VNILLVEDESAVLESVTTAFLHAGHSVVATGDGGEALRLYKQRVRHFDVVLTDIDHPGVEGIQLAGTIRKLNPQQAVAFQTTNADYRDSVIQQRMALYGVGDIPRIAKPYRLEQLLEFVQSLGTPPSHGG
jgi:CheY-like chemotaxis protein